MRSEKSWLSGKSKLVGARSLGVQDVVLGDERVCVCVCVCCCTGLAHQSEIRGLTGAYIKALLSMCPLPRGLLYTRHINLGHLGVGGVCVCVCMIV